MTLENILEWLKTLSTKADSYYAGTLPNKKERSFGVYQMKSSRKRDIALGGMQNTKTLHKAATVLVHWEQSTRSTETIAKVLYDELAQVRDTDIGGYKCRYIEPQTAEPVDVGADENGIMERVIDFIIYYQRKE